MKLVMHFRAVIASISGPLASEFDQLLARINLWSGREHLSDGRHGEVSVTALTFGGETQATVGGAGAAAALPVTPVGYLVVTIDGVDVVVPYFAKS